MQSTNELMELEKTVLSGAFRECYVIYGRKSTDEANNQKNSIKYQSTTNSRFAKQEGLPIADITISGFCLNGIISEKHSGFKERDDLVISDDGQVQYQIERPKFQKLLWHLNQGHFKGVICLCWDRISRNRGDDTVIRKLMRRGVDVRFVYANYDKGSAGELHMDIDGMFSQHHSRVTSEKVRETTRMKRSEGKCTYRAPIGYLNEGNIDHKPFDPERAPMIKEVFKLYATGDWSLSDLARHCNKMGFTTPPMRVRRTSTEMLDDQLDFEKRPKLCRPITVNSISSMLRNPFYVGRIMDSDGAYIESKSHKPLIDLKTFNKVQDMLKTKRISLHYTEKIDYPYRGFIRCAQCNRAYTPYEKKGNQYYLARCKKGCLNTYKNINLTYIDEQVASLLNALVFTDAENVRLKANVETEIALLEERRHAENDRLERLKRRVREDLAYLRTNQLSLLQSGVYTPDQITEERTRLEAELDAASEKEELSEAAMREVMADVLKISELLNMAKNLYILAKPHEKEQIVKTCCVELLVDENTANFKPKIGFEQIFERKFSMCAQSEWIVELSSKRDEIRQARKILENSIEFMSR